MLTYLELKQKVARLTKHVSVDADDVETFDADMLIKIGDWLNFAQRHLSEIYDFWPELQTTYDFDTADGVEAYDMPSDFDKPFRMYDLDNNREITPITEESYTDGHISSITDATEGEPSEYRIYGVSNRLVQVKLGLIPDDAYSIRVWYKKIPTDMSDDDDYAFIDADRYLIHDASGWAWKWEGQEEKANTSWAKAREALKILLDNYAKKLGTNYQQKMESTFMQAHRS